MPSGEDSRHSVARRRAQQCRRIEESWVRSLGAIMGRWVVMNVLNLPGVSWALCRVSAEYIPLYGV